MLSEANAPVIRATLPVVGEHLEAITGTFYETMLGDHPGLLNTFSRSAQATGEQKSALAGAIAAYGAHLAGLGGMPDEAVDTIVERIAARHAALGIRPEQYTLVGKYLLGAVGTVLGSAVTPAVAAAWDEVYWLFAVRLIGREARLYQGAGVTDREPFQRVTVLARERAAADTVSFTLSSAAPFQAGQYLSVAADLPDGTRQIRQYSLSGTPGAPLRITVRRVPGGAVSNWLHSSVHTGDTLTVSPPYGSLTLRPGGHPLLLVSAGVGITPMASILAHVADGQPGRAVTLAHAERTPDRHALRDWVDAHGSRIPGFRHLVWYGSEHGALDPARLPIGPDTEAYLCGPIPFMRLVRTALLARGVPAERIRYEVFGADRFTAAPTPALS
ncbi:globin domain-containing protein [Catenuloplanes indicus]|uniref:nitric oxide dioxygenase n=1 Tax=Catenuloplanes indicus TaxID=137267 RepID=A0AAE3VVI7_9ACTN|nr:globin domain-containing protein [Catenuloplanes indicus]MDQ0364596.1 nitric oxide dioxygenase [Catenuloplanes indicus]